MSNPVYDLFRREQNQCPDGYRFSYSEKRCVKDEFGLLDGSADRLDAISSLGRGYTPEVKVEDEPKESITTPTNTQKLTMPVWKMVLIGIVGALVLWMLYTYLKTGKIKLPKKITFKRPELPKYEVKQVGGALGGIGIE